MVSAVLVFLSALSALSALAKEDSKTKDISETPRYLTRLRDRSSVHVIVAAHRGGWENDKADQAPENSIANIKNCESKGYELFETDIRRTKDGVFVVFHDPTLERETNGQGSVEEMTLVQLKKVHKKYRDGSVSKEKVATFEEFLKAGHGRVAFKVDLKPGVSKHFDELMKLVIRFDAVDDVIFRPTYKEADLLARYRAQGGFYAKHLFMFRVSSKKQIDDIKKRFDSTTIQINVKKMNPANEITLDLIRYATAKGFVVQTHAEGGEKDWGKLVEAGVRIFHTNTPSRVQKFLKTLAD